MPTWCSPDQIRCFFCDGFQMIRSTAKMSEININNIQNNMINGRYGLYPKTSQHRVTTKENHSSHHQKLLHATWAEVVLGGVLVRPRKWFNPNWTLTSRKIRVNNTNIDGIWSSLVIRLSSKSLSESSSWANVNADDEMLPLTQMFYALTAAKVV